MAFCSSTDDNQLNHIHEQAFSRIAKTMTDQELRDVVEDLASDLKSGKGNTTFYRTVKGIYETELKKRGG